MAYSRTGGGYINKLFPFIQFIGKPGMIGIAKPLEKEEAIEIELITRESESKALVRLSQFYITENSVLIEQIDIV